LALVEAFTRFSIQDVTVPIVRAAIETMQRFNVSYWDAAIIEAARESGCNDLLSEDLSDGQDYNGVTVVNPFV
jgi:predicted nucleic acid-binding protein